MNWKSAPITQMHRYGKKKAQYESPYLCTAARMNDTRYAQAPMPTNNLFETLCWINAATRLASKPTTTMGSMCTPVIRAEYPSSVWK
jgi:hypothetical protein